MNKANIKDEFAGSGDITDGNKEKEPCKSITSDDRTGKLTERRKIPDRRKKLKKTPKESLAKDSINTPTQIGYSEGVSENPDDQGK